MRSIILYSSYFIIENLMEVMKEKSIGMMINCRERKM